MTDVVKPSGAGGSEASRKLVDGWRKIASGNAPSRNERIIKENQERTSGKPQVDNNYKPGDEDTNGEFNARKAKMHMQKLTEQKRSQMVFKGSATQVAMKLNILTEGVEADPDTGRKAIPGGKKVKVIDCEDIGMGQFKLTYLIED
jgi:hypothetical protein